MFGLTFEKLLVITIIAGFVIGPRRLPIYAGKLADFVRDLRVFVESTHTRAENDLGVPLRTSEWMDLRRYDPRRIVRDALDDDPIASGAAQTQQGITAPPTDPTAPASAVALPEGAAPSEPATRQQWIVAGGTSGHPRRILITEPFPEDQLPSETVAADAPATADPLPATAASATQSSQAVR